MLKVDLLCEFGRVEPNKLHDSADVVGPHGSALARQVVRERGRLYADVVGHPRLNPSWL